jgi:hypothetical protein
MRVTEYNIAAALIPVAAILTLGCFDPMTTPSLADGSIEITTSTTVANVADMPTTFGLNVGNKLSLAIGPNERFIQGNILVGTQLVGVTPPSYCTVSGSNPRSIVVTANAITPVTFSVSCAEKPKDDGVPGPWDY